MSKWIVLTGVEICEGYISVEDVVLASDKEQAEQIMQEYIDNHPDGQVVGFKITKELKMEALQMHG